jgi:hypothetical protein
MAFLTGWTYRKEITLSRASGAVTNYQMKLLVGESSGAVGENVDCGALCKTDFSDLRFTAADGTTLLDYWIESVSGTTPNQLATVWIEFDSIGTGATTFYMYYGNAGAAAYSSGDATFLFFDDFNDASIDGAKWTNTGSFSESGGTLSKHAVNGNQVYPCIGKTNIPHPCVLHAKTRVTDFNKTVDAAWGWTVSWGNGWTGDGFLGGHYADVGAEYSKIYHWPGASPTATLNETLSSDTWYLLDLYINSTKQYFYIDGTQKVSITSTPAVSQTFMTLAHSSSNNADYTTYYDYVFARQWTANETEPAWGSWGTEELGLQHYTLTLEPASFSMTGAVLRLLNNKKLLVGPGIYTMVGKDMGMPKTLVPFSLEPGAFAMVGSALSIKKPVSYMRMDPGAFAMNGAPMGLTYSWYRGKAPDSYQFQKQRRTF